MTENKANSNTENIVEFAIKGIQEKKGRQIVNLNLKKVEHAVCKNFIICHGDSTRQVSAIADAVEEFVRQNAKEKPWHIEGLQNAEWVLIDYSDVVVHIFTEQARNFYNLEGLWADAEITVIED